MNLTILGGKHFHNSYILDSILVQLVQEHAIEPDPTLVTDTNKGVANLAYNLWADYYNLPVEQYPVDDNYFGRGAILTANQRMVKRGDVVLVVWDGMSPRLRHAIWCARNDKKPLFIFDEEGHNITETFH